MNPVHRIKLSELQTIRCRRNAADKWIEMNETLSMPGFRIMPSEVHLPRSLRGNSAHLPYHHANYGGEEEDDDDDVHDFLQSLYITCS